MMMPSKKVMCSADCYSAKRYIVNVYLVNTWDVQSYIYSFKFQRSACRDINVTILFNKAIKIEYLDLKI